MRLRCTRLSLESWPRRSFLPLDLLSSAAAYSLRRLRTDYAGEAIRVRRSSDNAEQDIGFGAVGDLDLDALTLFCGAPRRPLLSIAGASAAYSLRRLGLYNGPAIRVRRSSDNAEQDIGFTAAGDLDTVALLAFVGVNSGFVTTWYDQSGNAHHAIQATAAQQPRIVNAGVVETMGGRPCAFFVDGPHRLALPATIPAAFALSVVGAPSGAGFRSVGTNPAGTTHYLLRNSGNTNTSVWVGSLGTSVGTWAENEAACFYMDHTNVTSANGLGGKNGAALVNSDRNFTEIPAALGNNNAGGNQQFGRMAEAIFLSTSSDAERQNLERSQSVYYGIAYASPIPSGFVATWYDQSDNAHHATQAAAANQPRIVNAGVVETMGGRPTVVGSGNEWLDSNDSLVARDVQSAVCRFGTGAETTFPIFNAIAGGTGRPGSAPQVLNSGELQGVGGANRFHNIAADIRRNGADILLTTPVLPMGAGGIVVSWRPNTLAPSTSGVRIFGEAEARYWVGPISELVFFPTNIALSDRQNLERSQAVYYGITHATTIPSGFVTTWYDQSGNARDSANATAAQQPRIVNAGVVETLGGRPAIFTNNSRLNFPTTTTTDIYTVLNTAATVPSLAALISDSSVTSVRRGVTQLPGWRGGGGPGGGDFAAATAYQINGATAVITLDGTGGVANPTGLNTVMSISGGGPHNLTTMFFTPFNPPRFYVGLVGELILFGSITSADARQNLERNQGGYYNITVT